MGFLSDMFTTNLALNRNNKEILIRWSDIGLLEGLDIDTKITLAFYMEILLRWLVVSEYAGNNELESCLFVIIRRVTGANKINDILFYSNREDNSYIDQVNSFTNKKIPTDNDDEMYVKNIVEFMSYFVADFIEYLDSDKPVELSEMLSHENIDREAELLAWYCENVFDFEKIIDKINYEKNAADHSN